MFVDTSAQWEPALVGGVNAVVANGIAANADVIGDALAIYIMIVGGKMAFGEMVWGRFVGHALRAVMIAVLTTAAGFNELIATPAMLTFPIWIAQAVNHNLGVAAGPEQFDLLRSAADHQTAAIYQQATGWEYLGYRLEAAAVNGLIGFVLLMCFGIYELSRGTIGVIVAALPFLLFLFLFDATRSVPERAIDKIIGLLVLQLLVTVLMQFILAADSMIMVKQLQFDAGLDVQIAALWSILLVFAFGLAMLIVLPAIAAYIGGGVSINTVGMMARLGSAALGYARGGIGVAGAAGSRGVNAARKVLAR